MRMIERPDGPRLAIERWRSWLSAANSGGSTLMAICLSSLVSVAR
jgi:hypothetical protein